jgi:hypothetical protein
MRRTLTSIVSVYARFSCQSAGRSASNGPVLKPSTGSVRAVQDWPSNSSRLRAFQYSGEAETTRMTSLPSRGHVIGP